MSGKRTVFTVGACWMLFSALCVDRAGGYGCWGDPPGDPYCCWCENGVWVCECEVAPNCGSCWMCVDGCCVSCWCWDDGAVIKGKIYVPTTCAICDEVRFTADVNDYDHWASGWGNEQFPRDSVTYTWSTSPPVGVWLSEQGFMLRDWQAPPCIQTVDIQLEVDDVPDPSYAACYGHSDRNDNPKLFAAPIQVVLPTGCRQGQASVELLLREVDALTCCQQPGPERCGCTLPIEPPTEGHIDAVYDDCTWVFDIFIVWDVESGVCSDAIDISSGSDSDLTEGNYCDIVNSMKNGTGCACVGLGKYTSYACAGIHEAYHMAEFREDIDDPNTGEEKFVRDGLPTEPINCTNPNSTTCQAVEAMYMEQLQNDVDAAMRRAYDRMRASGEGGAVDAARPCFETLAGQICSHAQSQSWAACPACQ